MVFSFVVCVCASSQASYRYESISMLLNARLKTREQPLLHFNVAMNRFSHV